MLENLFFSMDMEESEKTISEVIYLVWTKKKKKNGSSAVSCLHLGVLCSI